MAFQIFLLLLIMIALAVIGLLPGEIARSRVALRLKDIGKRKRGRSVTSWQEDISAICDEHLGGYLFYKNELSRMNKAGYLEHWRTGLFLVAQVFCVLLGAFVVIGVINHDFGSFKAAFKTILISVCILAVCAGAPRLWLMLRTTENLKRLRKTMPIAVELMTICMESGNGLEQTFEKVGRELLGTNPQIAMRLLDVRSTMVAYDRKWALERLERESFFEEEKELARSLLESLRYGTPLVTALRALAQRMREENMNRLEEVAGKASTKMTIPMIVFLLLPVIVIMLAEPTIQFLRSWQ